MKNRLDYWHAGTRSAIKLSAYALALIDGHPEGRSAAITAALVAWFGPAPPLPPLGKMRLTPILTYCARGTALLSATPCAIACATYNALRCAARRAMRLRVPSRVFSAYFRHSLSFTALCLTQNSARSKVG
jgi:hypothetical protein